MFSAIVKKLQEYFKVKAEQIKLEVMARVAKLLSHVIAISALAFLGLFMMFFLSLGLGAFLNSLLESEFWGYLIVSGAYLLLFIILALLAKTGRIQNFLETLIIRLNDQLEDEDE